MTNISNKTCICAALFGAVLVALPASAAGVGNTAGVGVGTGATTGVAGTSPGTGVNTTGQVTTPAGALNSNAQANADAAVALSDKNKVGGSVSTGGMTSSGDLDSATAGNNAGSVNRQAQAETPARRMAHRAQANANAATEEAYNGQSDNGPQGATNTAGKR